MPREGSIGVFLSIYYYCYERLITRSRVLLVLKEIKCQREVSRLSIRPHLLAKSDWRIGQKRNVNYKSCETE